MAKKFGVHVSYSFCYGAHQPSVASFKIAEGVWVRATEGQGKTPYAIASWAASESQPHPVWVRWEKPRSIAEMSGRYQNYARTEATALFFGETTPRRLRVTFDWRYSVYYAQGCEIPNLPEANGGGWEVEDLGPDHAYNPHDGRTFPVWEGGEPDWARSRAVCTTT